MNFINISKGALAAVLLALAVSACSDVDFPQTPTEPSVTSLDYTIEGRSVTLNWTLPEGDIESTQLYSDNVLLAELDPGVTSYTIKRQSANREVLYTLKLKYANGISSLGFCLRWDNIAFCSEIMILGQYITARHHRMRK